MVYSPDHVIMLWILVEHDRLIIKAILLKWVYSSRGLEHSGGSVS